MSLLTIFVCLCLLSIVRCENQENAGHIVIAILKLLITLSAIIITLVLFILLRKKYKRRIRKAMLKIYGSKSGLMTVPLKHEKESALKEKDEAPVSPPRVTIEGTEREEVTIGGTSAAEQRIPKYTETLQFMQNQAQLQQGQQQQNESESE